jgi:hypothetical protein
MTVQKNIANKRHTRKNMGAKGRGLLSFLDGYRMDDIESIKGFAGDYEKAKYYPEDEGILLEFEEKVIHCETYIRTAIARHQEEIRFHLVRCLIIP